MGEVSHTDKKSEVGLNATQQWVVEQIVTVFHWDRLGQVVVKTHSNPSGWNKQGLYFYVWVDLGSFQGHHHVNAGTKTNRAATIWKIAVCRAL